MMKDFKYAKQSINLFCSIIWGILCIIHFSLLINLLFNSSYRYISNLFFLELLFCSVGAGALSIMYANLYLGNRIYISIRDNQLIIDQGLIRPKKEISLLDVRKARKIGTQLQLDVGNRREIKVHLNCLKVEDIDIIENKLDSFNIQF